MSSMLRSGLARPRKANSGAPPQYWPLPSIEATKGHHSVPSTVIFLQWIHEIYTPSYSVRSEVALPSRGVYRTYLSTPATTFHEKSLVAVLHQQKRLSLRQLGNLRYSPGIVAGRTKHSVLRRHPNSITAVWNMRGTHLHMGSVTHRFKHELHSPQKN
jgi:hypothetical protein